MKEKPLIFPAQCSCGHIILERFTIPKSWKSEYRGFAYCGFCRKRTYVGKIETPSEEGAGK